MTRCWPSKQTWHLATAVIVSIIFHLIFGAWCFGLFSKYSVPQQTIGLSDDIRINARLLTAENKEYSNKLQASQDTQNIVPPPTNGSKKNNPNNINLQNKYLTIEEVDIAAQPVGDWVIDFSKLQPGNSSVWVIEMWISATGKLEHWNLLSELENRDVAIWSLRELGSTPINAARLNGQPVASFRRIEITIDIDQ